MLFVKDKIVFRLRSKLPSEGYSFPNVNRLETIDCYCLQERYVLEKVCNGEKKKKEKPARNVLNHQ